MKNIYSLLIFAAALTASLHSSAQVPAGITINYAGDTIGFNNPDCTAPDTAQIYLYGTAGGYLPTDSVTVYIAFGDGSDTLYLTPIQNGYFWTYFDHIYSLPGIYSLYFIVTGPDGDADTVTVTNAVIVANGCGNISGKVYLDANTDCVFNAGDAPVQWNMVKLLYNGSYLMGAYTDVNGDYSFSAPTGYTYTVEVNLPNNNLTVNCPVAGFHIVSTLPASNKDFSLECSQAGFDLSGDIYCWGVRPGFTANIYFDAWNESCTAVSGSVTITLPAGLSFVSSVPAPSNINGSIITYNVANYPYQWNYPWGNQMYMTVLGAVTLQVGDSVCVQMTVDPVAGDLDPADNSITLCIPVRNSCDPNEKYETHAKWGTASVAPGTELDYTIFFQNVGNDDAYNIAVVDTLDADLDLETLNIKSASHPMNIRMQGKDIIKFEFLNIMLPAASVNEPESHGFISYSIMPKSNLANGTAIDNTAHIFFDFNAAVVTNTVTDIIDLSLGVTLSFGEGQGVRFFPNPAKDFFRVKLGDESFATMQVTDISGRSVAEQIISDNETVSLEKLSVGTYTLTITSEQKRYAGKIVVIK